MDKPIETKETVSGTTKTNDESETTEMNNVEKADEDVPLPTTQTPTSEESVPKLAATSSSSSNVEFSPSPRPPTLVSSMLKTSGSAGNSIFLPSNPELVPASSSAHSQTHKKNITDLHRLLLIEDSTRDEVPSHLVTLFKALEPRRPSRADILAILVYAHALESGFYPSGAVQIGPRIETCWSYSFNTQFVKTFSSVLPDIYHGYDMGSYDFRLELFSHSRQFCLLLARETDDRLCINFITEQRAHSVVVLPISRYIKRQSLQSPAKCLQNVKELSMRLRGELFLPMRNAVLAVETSLYPGLLGLPGELQQTIMAYLDSKALQQLAITCVSMCNQVFAFKNVRSRKFGSARPEIQ